ncbi:MAG: EVE domain-containing protein [Polyangiaceae bacterium]|nr:EVE domain-containing protein [Polyangiaceae bacterium]
MAYFLDLFSPETHAMFSASDRGISGFRIRHRKAAERVKRGDVFICYLTRLSRWVGLLEVVSEPFEDASPLFVEKDDPFVVRFKVKPLVWLPPRDGIPIHEQSIWSRLSFTKEHEPDSTTWTGAVRTSLGRISDEDAKFLDELLRAQAAKPKEYALDAAEARALQPHKVRREDGEVTVSVPDDRAEPKEIQGIPEARESIKVQALLAQVGARMGFRVWIPAPDRAAVLKEAPSVDKALLDALPLNYDNTTLRTIENIDVLWLKGRSMARAFEVEHTTAIYSGILRMADLLALQPNMDIRLHIAAPEARKQKVFDEIRRPVFSLLQGKALAERCTFLSYDSIRELASVKHLEHLSDSVLEEYEEEASA